MANKKVSQLTSKPSVLTTDLFPIADPSTGQLYKTTISDLGTAIGSGVSSVNGLVGAVVLDTDDIQELVSPTNKWFTDTRARAALSASSPLTYNSGTGVFGIQVANGSQNGYLSSADWTTFNAKQAALSGTGFVKSTGGTISYDTNTYLTTSSAASTYLALAGGTMTGALFGASASFSGYVGFNGNTSPLYPVDVAGSGRFSGDLRIESTNPRIYLTDTDNNPDYFISNTDGTFTVYDVTNSASRLTIGTSGAATFLNSVTASALYVTGMTAGSGAIYHTGSRLTFANYNASGTLHFEVNGGTGALTINADKTSSFLGGITVTPSTTYATIVTGGIQLQSYASTNNLIGLNSYFNGTVDKYYDNGFANQIQVNGGVFYFKTAPSGVAGNNITYTTALTIANTGAATFSSSVTATSATFSGNISMQAPTGVGTFISFKNDSNTSGFDIGHLNGGGAGAYIYQRANQPIIFGTNNAEIVRFLANGNVGIGTTSPASKLHIEGTGTGAWLTINRTDSGTNLVDYTQSGTRLGYIGYIGSELWINNATASDISIRTSGSERMRITSGGNVGIGTTSPANYTNYITQTINGTNGAIVQLQSSGTPSLRLIGEGVDSYLDNVSTGALIFRTTSSSSERMRITSDGKLLVGITAASGRITLAYDQSVNNQFLNIVGTQASYNQEWGFGIPTNTRDFRLYDYTAGLERMRITSGGNVGIGTTGSSSIRLIVCGQDGGSSNFSLVGADNLGNTRFSVRNDGLTSMLTAYSDRYRLNDTGGGFVTLEMENSARWRINYLGRFSGYGAGALTTDASGNITAASDRTLKDIIKPVENVLENIMDFEPVYFKWNDKTDLDKENVYMSTIAQSIQKHYPDAVGKMADGTLTVQDRAVTAILVQAIKELKAKIETLENK